MVLCLLFSKGKTFGLKIISSILVFKILTCNNKKVIENRKEKNMMQKKPLEMTHSSCWFFLGIFLYKWRFFLYGKTFILSWVYKFVIKRMSHKIFNVIYNVLHTRKKISFGLLLRNGNAGLQLQEINSPDAILPTLTVTRIWLFTFFISLLFFFWFFLFSKQRKRVMK